MSELKAAAEAVRGLEKSYRAVLTLGEAVGKIADIEAYGEEVSRDTALAKKQNSEAILALAITRGAVDEAEEKVKAAETEAKKAIADAAAEAGELIRKGNDQVRRMLADARAEVQQAQTAIQQAQDLHKQWMEAAEIEKTKVLNETQAIKAELAALKARLG